MPGAPLVVRQSLWKLCCTTPQVRRPLLHHTLETDRIDYLIACRDPTDPTRFFQVILMLSCMKTHLAGGLLLRGSTPCTKAVPVDASILIPLASARRTMPGSRTGTML